MDFPLYLGQPITASGTRINGISVVKHPWSSKLSRLKTKVISNGEMHSGTTNTQHSYPHLPASTTGAKYIFQQLGEFAGIGANCID